MNEILIQIKRKASISSNSSAKMNSPNIEIDSNAKRIIDNHKQ
jgi:hypothetical protein